MFPKLLKVTQLTEAVRKPNISIIKSNTIKQPKTAIKLKKPLKRPQIITQQPKTVKKKDKIKNYKKSGATNYQKNLVIIRRHDHLLQKYLQFYEIKYLSFKELDEQLNLARLCIK